MTRRFDDQWLLAYNARLADAGIDAKAPADALAAPSRAGLRAVRQEPLPDARRVPALTVVLPWPPSANHAYRPGNELGARFLTDEHKEFRQEVNALAWQLRRPWVGGRLHIELDLYPPSRRGDADNSVKHVFDALQAAGFIVNDRAVESYTVRRHAPRSAAAITATIEEILDLQVLA